MSFVKQPLPVLPDVITMHAQLRQSGILDMRSVFETTSLEQTALADTAMTTVHLAHASVENERSLSILEPITASMSRYLPKIVSFLLILQGLRGIYTSLDFILVEFPQLESLLSQHLVTSTQINQTVSKAVILAVHTMISLVFATHLAFLESKAAKIIKISIGILLLVGHGAIESYFAQQNSGIVLADSTAHLFNGLYVSILNYTTAFFNK